MAEISPHSSRHSPNSASTDFSRIDQENEYLEDNQAVASRWQLEDQTQPDCEANVRSPEANPSKPQPWQVQFLPDESAPLRPSSRFNFQQSAKDLPQSVWSETGIADILLSHDLEEEDRESFYCLEVLYMFRQRLRLVAFLGLALLPIFHLFYLYLSPQVAQQTRITHLLMAGVCALYVFLTNHMTSLTWARLSAVIGYALMCLGASLITVILEQNRFDQTSLSGLHLAILAAHSQILVSIVLLPLTLWESMVMCVIVTASLAWASWWMVPIDGGGSVQTSQLFVIATTAVFVLCLAHFQSVLRRRAFDATFDLASSMAQMQTISIQDAVTGGHNRLYLERNLTLEINRTVRFSRPLSVMMFDLDNFKNVNDTVGHTAGDEVLRVVNRAAELALRDVDTLARYGGDEFVVVLPETESDDALAIAQRLQMSVRSQLQSSFGAQTPEGQVTLSIGIVTLHLSSPVTTKSVIARVDERLYEAKRMGKNRIAI